MIAKIPFSKIERVSIYLNRSKKSVSDIKKATEEDYVLNGTLYDMGTFQPVCHLRADGETACQPAYTTYGYAWDELPELEVIPDKRGNHDRADHAGNWPCGGNAAGDKAVFGQKDRWIVAQKWWHHDWAACPGK